MDVYRPITDASRVQLKQTHDIHHIRCNHKSFLHFDESAVGSVCQFSTKLGWIIRVT